MLRAGSGVRGRVRLVGAQRAAGKPRCRTLHGQRSLLFAPLSRLQQFSVDDHSCLQQTRTKVFVSKHNDLNISAHQITDYCSAQGISPKNLRQNHSHVILKECPFCPKPTGGKADNHYKLHILIGGGAYYCHRCGAKGSWYDFKMKLSGYTIVGIGDAASISQSNPPSNLSRTSSTSIPSEKSVLPMPQKRLSACYNSNLMEKNNAVLEYLTNVRGLDKATLRTYGVGRATYNFPSSENNKYVPSECVTFPWIMREKDVKQQEELREAVYEPEGDGEGFCIRRIKARSLENKGWQRMDPAGGGWGLFGFHTIRDDAKEIVITEGEYDAMAVYQATGRPSVSLPNGCRSLPVEVLPMLERFEKIYLWMDNDGPGQEGAEKFATKIGIKRCYIVKPTAAESPKDANEALLKGLDLNKMIKEASILEHEFIVRFRDLRAQVLNEIINPEKYVGVPVTSLPKFTGIVKGFRRGEVTVLTGPTGSGKTTFLGQLSLDFAEQGINTLWGSFEIKNTRLIHKLLQQFSRQPLPAHDEEQLESLADRFEMLPLHFMKFHGGSDVDEVLNAMDYATYVHDVEHIIIDNMQFMISRLNQSSSFDKFDVQDVAVEKFRHFATDKNVHVTLVVHPRKEEDGSKLSISSIYGSAKATQEADTVLILQSDGRSKSVEVKKNRFDGTLGSSPLFFERESGRYLEQSLNGLPPSKDGVRGSSKFRAQIPVNSNAVDSSGPRSSSSAAVDGDSGGDPWAFLDQREN